MSTSRSDRGGLFTQPWNLWVPLPWFVLFVFLVWIATDSAFGQLIAMSIAGSFLVQTHVGYARLGHRRVPWVAGPRVVGRAGRGTGVLGARRSGSRPASGRDLDPRSSTSLTEWPGNLGAIAATSAQRGHPGGGAPSVGLIAAAVPVPAPRASAGHAEPSSKFRDPASSAWILVPVCDARRARRPVVTRSRSDRRGVGSPPCCSRSASLRSRGSTSRRGVHLRMARSSLAAFVVVVTALGARPCSRRACRSRARTVGVVAAVVVRGLAFDLAGACRLDGDARSHGATGGGRTASSSPAADGPVMGQLAAPGVLDRGRSCSSCRRRGGVCSTCVVNELDRDGFDVRVLAHSATGSVAERG